MVQFMSPTCRAARRPQVKQMQHAHAIAMLPLLRRMNDLDLKQLAHLRLAAQRKGLVRGWAGILIVYLPLIYIFAGEFFADLSFEVIMPTISSGVILISNILQLAKMVICRLEESNDGRR